MDNKRIGKTIKDLRLQKGLSQGDVAKICSITTQAVSKWERGESIPDISSLESLSNLYGVSINHIINSDAVVIPSKPRNSLIYQMIIIILAIVVFIFPMYVKDDDVRSGFNLIVSGTYGTLIQAIRVSFLVYVGLLVHTVIMYVNKGTYNKVNLGISMTLTIATMISNGIAISQSNNLVDSMEFLVGFSVIILIINVYEFVRKLYISTSNINAINTISFTTHVLNLSMIVYFFALLGMIDYDLDHSLTGSFEWYLLFSAIPIMISIGLHITYTLAKSYTDKLSRLVLILPMIGSVLTYFMFMIFVDKHRYTDDIFILLILLTIQALPLTMIVYKQKVR